MSASLRDHVIAPRLAALPARVSAPRRQADLGATLENLRRRVPEATRLTLCAHFPQGIDAWQARQAVMATLDQWSAVPTWFESASLAVDVAATGTAADFSHALAGAARRARVGLLLDLPAAPHQVDPGRHPCEGPEALRRMATHLQPLLTPTITLASRWLRSRDDARWAVEQGLPVRLVPGVDADPQQPQRDACASVRALVRQIAGKVPSVTLAWPDPGTVTDLLRSLLKAGTPCDLEWQAGSPNGAQRQLARGLKVPMRVIAPWTVSTIDLNTPNSVARPQ